MYLNIGLDFFILGGLRQNVSLKEDKLWKLNYAIKKLNEKTNNYRDFVETIVSMELPQVYFLYSAKTFFHLRWRKRNAFPEHVRIQIRGYVAQKTLPGM